MNWDWINASVNAEDARRNAVQARAAQLRQADRQQGAEQAELDGQMFKARHGYTRHDLAMYLGDREPLVTNPDAEYGSPSNPAIITPDGRVLPDRRATAAQASRFTYDTVIAASRANTADPYMQGHIARANIRATERQRDLRTRDTDHMAELVRRSKPPGCTCHMCR